MKRLIIKTIKSICLVITFLTLTLRFDIYAQTLSDTVVYPDNVDSVDCSFPPQVSTWGVKVGWSSSAVVHARNTPFVGDLDGDGVPEIMCFSSTGVDRYGTASRCSRILVYDGVTKALKATIISPSPLSSYDAASYGMVKLPNGKGLIIVATYDLKLRAYDITAANPSTPYWVSNVNYGESNGHWAVNIGFADFNHDGHPEIYVRNKIYNAETGVLLATATGGGKFRKFVLPLYACNSLDAVFTCCCRFVG